MKLKNSLFDKVQNENSLHSDTQKEFSEIKSIIPKLNKENQYLSLYDEIKLLVENGSFDSLQKASALMSEREFIYDHSFQKSDETIFKPNEQSSLTEKVSFLNYLKKQIYFQNNYQIVKEHFDLHKKVAVLASSLSYFKDKHPDKTAFSGLNIIIGAPIISFLIYAGFLELSGNNVNSFLNIIFALIFLGSLFMFIFGIYDSFFTKKGLKNISDYKIYFNNKSIYDNLNIKLNKLKIEINSFANENPTYEQIELKQRDRLIYNIQVSITKFLDFGLVVETENGEEGFLPLKEIKDSENNIKIVKEKYILGDILFVREKPNTEKEGYYYYSQL